MELIRISGYPLLTASTRDWSVQHWLRDLQHIVHHVVINLGMPILAPNLVDKCKSKTLPLFDLAKYHHAWTGATAFAALHPTFLSKRINRMMGPNLVSGRFLDFSSRRHTMICHSLHWLPILCTTTAYL